ncbi:MAG TPA: hypothetical protein VM819_15250 [Vicinamibacterales bacterium]|nr:hypothetical protein [Vicinamibacterales bacterium]
MRTQTMIREIVAALLLAGCIFAPGVVAFAQAPEAPPNPLMNLPKLIQTTPGCLGVETAMTQSGKMVIFAWFENKKAALAWYYSQAHQALMKTAGGGAPRPRGPMADVPDDGRPIMAIASVTLSRPQEGIPQTGLPPVSQIAIELYAPLPGGLAAGGRFAPASVTVPGLLATSDPTALGSK